MDDRPRSGAGSSTTPRGLGNDHVNGNVTANALNLEHTEEHEPVYPQSNYFAAPPKGPTGYPEFDDPDNTLLQDFHATYDPAVYERQSQPHPSDPGQPFTPIHNAINHGSSAQYNPGSPRSGEPSIPAKQEYNPEYPVWGRLQNSNDAKESPWARKVILSLDGGGVRGYASLLILKKLLEYVRDMEEAVSKEEMDKFKESLRGASNGHISTGPSSPEVEKMKEVEDRESTLRGSSAAYTWSARTMSRQDTARQRPDERLDRRFRPHHYIDYFAGTSTGGLSAIMLGRLQSSVQTALDQYRVVGKGVFAEARPVTGRGILRHKFKGRYMDKALQHITLELANRRADEPKATALLAETVHLRSPNPDGPRTIVVAHGGKEAREVRLLRSYDHPTPSTNPGLAHLQYFSASNEPPWRVARATSAAPTYFSHAKLSGGKFVDGAVQGDNNPISLTYREVTQMHPGFEPKLVISIGTGIKKQAQSPEPKNFSGLNGWNTRKSFQSIILNTEPKHHDFETMVNRFNRGKEADDPERLEYFRFNVPETKLDNLADIKLGEWKGNDGSDTVQKMTRAVEAYLNNDSVMKQLKACAKVMVQIRRRRQATVRWERFAHQVEYHCPEPGDHCEGRVYASRLKLRKHAIRDHGFVWQVPCIERLQGRGSVTHEWACYWDQCGERSVSVFTSKDDFVKHLKLGHKIDKPVIKTDKEFEDWLDRGRKPQDRARVETTISQYDHD